MLSTTYDVSLDGLDESYFRDNEACQAWVNKLITFMNARYQSPNISIGAYLYGSATFIAMDIANADPSLDISYTIALKPGCIRLPADIANCSDLVLSGIVDAFLLVDIVIKATSGSLSILTHYH